MGAFLYIRKSRHPDDTAATAPARRAIAAMEKRGLPVKAILQRPGFELRVYRKRRFDSEDIVEFDNGDFIVATGTLFYRQRFGTAALRDLHADIISGGPSFDDLLGHFAVLACHGGKLTLFNDYQGMYQVYQADDFGLVSSSFLALTESCETLTPRPQEVYEYLAFSKFYSQHTVFDEIKRIDYRKSHTLLPAYEATPKNIELPDFDPAADFDLQVETTYQLLRQYFGTLVDAFGDRISIGLTGGYDSRLVLAYLRHCGANPRVYVQGPPDSSDVTTAKAISQAVGFEIEHDANEAAPRFEPADFLDELKAAYLYLDGLTHTGLFNAFALVADERGRIARPEKLRLYGMAGEIYRRTLSLPDRPVSFADFFAVQADKSDYSAFRTGGPTPFDKEKFYGVVGDKMADEMGLTGRLLTAEQTELSYPHFRLATMSGWQMTAQNERAHALVPFSEPLLTYPSGCVPIRYRRGGRFQAALIERADPELAALPTAYGYTLRAGPGLRQRARSAVLEAVPKRLHPTLYRYRARIRKPKPRPFYLQPDYLETVFRDGFPEVSSFVDVDAIRDDDLLSKALTLELLLSGRFAAGD